MQEIKLCVLGLGGQSVFMEVEHFHAPGETLHCAHMDAEPGGKGYNQAVAAARLGARVSFIGAVGDDPNGGACRDWLVKEGVAPLLQTIDGCATAYACILTDAKGENRVTVFTGAADRLSAAFVYAHEAQIAQSDALLLNFEVPREANDAATDIAQAHGVPVFLNPAPFRPTPLSILQKTSVLTPNRHEAVSLMGLPEAATLDQLQAALMNSGLRRVAVTLGGEGALLLENGRALHIPAQPCKAVDTTGAGDCFTAALAVGLSEGETFENAAAHAILAAGHSVERRHVMPGLPYRSELNWSRRTS